MRSFFPVKSPVILSDETERSPGVKDIIRQIQETKRRVSMILSPGTIHSVDDEQKAQATFLTDETKDQTRIVQHYGFTSRPLRGARCLAICPGKREQMVITGTKDPRYEPGLKAGEVCLWSHNGASVHLQEGGTLEIRGKALVIRQQDTGTELLTLLSDVLQGLENAMTATMSGPQPLSTQGIFQAARQKLSHFMKG